MFQSHHYEEAHKILHNKNGEAMSEAEQKEFLEKRRKLIVTIAAGALAVSLAITGFLVGIGVGKDKNNPETGGAPASTDSATPSASPEVEQSTTPAEAGEPAETTTAPTETTQPTESARPTQSPEATNDNSQTESLPTVESLEVDASLISDPELLSKTFIDDLDTKWYNSGASLENARAAFDFGSLPIYAKKVAAEYDEIFIKATLIEGWESKPNLVEYVKRTKERHAQTLRAYFATSGANIALTNPNDIEPYMRGSKFVQVNSSYDLASGGIMISTTEYEYDNADKNRIGEALSKNTKVDSSYTVGQGPTRYYAIENGKIKMSDIKFE